MIEAFAVVVPGPADQESGVLQAQWLGCLAQRGATPAGEPTYQFFDDTSELRTEDGVVLTGIPFWRVEGPAQR